MIRCLRSALRVRKAPVTLFGVLLPVMLLCLMVEPSQAAVVPKASPLGDKVFRNPNLNIVNVERSGADLGAPGAQLTSLGADNGLYDWRGARWSSLVLSIPLVPGDGKGNSIAGTRPPAQSEVWRALSNYVSSHGAQLMVNLAEVPSANIGIYEKGNIIQVHAARVVGGIPVRDSGLSAMINHGNLILLGLQNWGNVDATTSPALSADAARAVVEAHVKPFPIAGYNDSGHLERVPLARGQDLAAITPGRGYDYRLVWAIYPRIGGDMGTWEALVDAVTGELLAFQDINNYAARRIIGGVYPLSNDQNPPDGTEQAGWPMPFTNVVGAVNSITTGSGQVTVCEMNNIQTTLNGQFIRIVDNCGAVNENSAAGDLNMGVSGGDDCTVPAGHSVGDTHAARTGMYELNRIKEQARGHITSGPGSVWLNAQLISNMNINLNCNAFWNGTTVNFYRSGSGCGNTGEIAAVFDHEWGHGIDDNGINGTISNPGEAIADLYGVLRLDNSCMGRGFFLSGNCNGYGDPCTSCSGVRELDFAKHTSGQPHGIDWIQSNCGGGSGPCGREVHCEGMVPAEAGWDLQARDLRAAPFNYDENTALELTTRLMYLGPQTLTSWYTCSGNCEASGLCGCGATGGYLLILGADDDDGSIANGTPHMQAINAAFARHQIHCSTQQVINAGCGGGPTAAPVAAAAPSATVDAAIDVSWNAIAGATTYGVYRTESAPGVGCSFGKIKVGETSSTTFTEGGLLDGRNYNYSVLPIGTNTSCFGLMSNCSAAVPSPKNDPCVPVELQTFDVQ